VPRICQNDLFGLNFCLPINAQWIDRVRLDVVAFAPVKNQIGGKEYKISLHRQGGQMGRGLDVDFFGQGGIGLTGVALGQRRAMDDQGRALRAKPFLDGGKIREVKL